MNIAIIHAGEHEFIAKLVEIFSDETHNVKIFEPTIDDFSEVTEKIGNFDPHVVLLSHNFEGFTGDRLVSEDSLSYGPEMCVGISSGSFQRDYCHFRIDPKSKLGDPVVKQAILDAIHRADTI